MFYLAIEAANLKPWGLFGSFFAALAVALTGICIYLGRSKIKSDKIYNIIVFIFALIFVSMELTHEIGRYKQFGQYDWSSFPFQMCSVSMYIALAVPFIKKGNFKNYFIMFFATFTLLSGILPLYFAQGNLFRWPTLGGILFSFIWHILLLMLGGLSLGYLNVGHSFRLEIKPLIYVALIFIGITCIAQILNVFIHFVVGGWEAPLEGFKHAGYLPNYELDPDSVSLFYISPYFQSNIPFVLDEVWSQFGWVVCWIVYALAFILLELIVYFSSYLIRKAYKAILNAQAKKKDYATN